MTHNGFERCALHCKRGSLAMVNNNGFKILYLMVIPKMYLREDDLRTLARGKQQHDPPKSYREYMVSKTCQYERKKSI